MLSVTRPAPIVRNRWDLNDREVAGLQTEVLVDAHLERAIDEVRRLARSYERLLRGHPTPAAALQNTQSAFAELMTTLTRPEFRQRLDAMLPEARRELYQAHDELVHTFLDRHDQIVTQEARILRRLQLSRRDMARLVRLFVRTHARRQREPPKIIGGADEILAMFELLYAQALSRLARLRDLPRARKKRAKKRLRAAIWSLLFGAGAIVGNLHLPEVFLFSFALGGTAIYHATRQLIEEAP